MIRQNILLTNSNKSNVYNLNNDLNLIFPSNLFFKAPKFLELLNLDLNLEINLIGNTNNAFIIKYKSENHLIVIDSTNGIKTDTELSTRVTYALNNPLNPNDPLLSKPYSAPTPVFTVTETLIENILTNYRMERESSTTAFKIKSTYPVTFNFNIKDSIGPLMGFGNGIYENTTEINSTSTQSITSYYYIDVLNDSAGSSSNSYNISDINCKMLLFDSSGNVLVNYIPDPENPGQFIDSLDTTISLNSNVGYRQYSTIGEVLKLIEIQMNTFSDSFNPPANFNITYSYENKSITITNSTGAKFGIGFDFTTIEPVQNNTTGSLHYILGFEQKNYYNLTSITSVKTPLIFDDVFSDDYVLICSDIVNNATDMNVIGIGNANNVKSNNILFAIPLRQIKNFTPYDTIHYRINIASSNFSLGYKNRKFSDSNPNYVNFYLRLLSGRHITAVSQYSMQISFIF